MTPTPTPPTEKCCEKYRAGIEKIVCEEFKEGESFAYVSYDDDDLSAVTIDGNFDLKELILNIETLIQHIAKEEYDRGYNAHHEEIHNNPTPEYICVKKQIERGAYERGRKDALEDVAQAVSNNAGQEIIECVGGRKDYMECIEHVEVILRKRLAALETPS